MHSLLHAGLARRTVIVFSSRGSLYRVDAGGGRPALVKQKRDSDFYFYPQFLPDGRNVLYTSVSPVETERGAFVISLDTGTSKRLSGGNYKTIYSAGYLLSVQNGDLFAQEFDTKRLRLSSEAHRLPDRVSYLPNGSRETAIDAAEGGQLVYVPPALTDEQLSWFDRSGRVEQKVGPVAEYRVPTLAPDGRKLAFDRMPAGTGVRQVWVLDLENETLTRIAADQSNNWAPVWSPDGRTLAFSSDRDGFTALYLHSSDGQGADQLLLKAELDNRAQMWSAPGLLVSDKGQLRLLNPEDHKVTALPNIGNFHSQFSPDGRFIAFESGESGTPEIYLRRFPISPERWRVSSKGGLAPLWRRDGRELYYLRPDGKLIAAKIQPAPQINIGKEEILFQTPFSKEADFRNFRSSYAVAPDGSKFLFPEKGRNQTVSMTVIFNWPAMLQH